MHTTLVKYCLIEITTPVDCPRVSLVYINIAYYTSKSGIWLVVSRVASYFHEPEASANTAYELNNIAIFHDVCIKWFILYFIFF